MREHRVRPANSTELHELGLAGQRELRQRLESIAFRQADALLFPTTTCGAPLIEDQ